MPCLTVSYTLIGCSVGIALKYLQYILLIPNQPFGTISSWCPVRGLLHLTSWKFAVYILLPAKGMFLLLDTNFQGSPNTSLQSLKMNSEASNYPPTNLSDPVGH